MPAPQRSLADALRGMDDAALVRLLRLRPDLTVPMPGDLSALASRAGSRSSVQRALDGLTLAELQALHRLATRPDAAAPADEPDDVLGHLRALALVFGEGKVVSSAVALISAEPPPGEPRPLAPALPADPVTADVDAGAAGAAAELVRLVESLGNLWDTTDVGVLRAGGLGVRELRRTASALEVDEATAALVAELAHGAGLVAREGQHHDRWAPTDAFDTWCGREPAERWSVLAHTWLTMPGCPHLAGTRDVKGTPRAALSQDVAWTAAPQLRRWLLATVAELPPGTATTPAALLTRYRWTAPRLVNAPRDALLAAALAEAATLGLTAHGALASHARALLDDAGAAARALATALPAPVDHVLLQADLTAVAPGPLRRDLARRLETMADVESRGGATVFRLSAASVRRALDHGMTADDVLSWLREHSRTPVPQPLEYLVGDVARRHGAVRVSTVTTVVRSDDETALSALLADRRCASLHLRRLAPTVLGAQAEPEDVLRVLRDLGHGPVAESDDGTMLLPRSGRRRAPARPRAVRYDAPDDAALAAAVATLRRLDALTAHPVPPGTPPPLGGPPADPTTVRLLLDHAARSRTTVWLSFVDGEGRPDQRLVRPFDTGGGRVLALTLDSAQVLAFPLARVTGVAPVG